MPGPCAALHHPVDRSRRSRRGSAPAVVAVALGGVLALAGCKGIDKTQWRDFPISTASAAARVEGAGSGGAGDPAPVGGSPGDLGVVTGARAGTHRSTAQDVVVDTPIDTCWYLVVDSFYNSGCGPARVADSHGTPAGRVTKISGPSTIKLSVVSENRTVSSDQVSTVGHYVTVGD